MEGRQHPLYKKFPPSEECSCSICRSYCQRPGWPLVEEVRLAIEAGLSHRLMLEFSPDHTFGILVPAFKGNEGYFALAVHKNNGCTFLQSGSCSIYDKLYRPLECRFCHHERKGEGLRCHLEIASLWNCSKGKRLVRNWMYQEGLAISFVS